MNLKLKSLRLENFKGVSKKEITFDGNAKICGQNGTGKTTIADAFYWLFADCDYSLTKNPIITPLNASECVSTVEAELDIDGKPVSVSKSQKFKSKTNNDGKTTSSVTNSYAINSVEKSQRDFIADMTERGFDFDKFLALSHPESFTSDTSKKGREEMRKILFGMVEDITDEDIAKKIDVPELNALLEKGYKIDEVEQMQKSTLKKITDVCGKDNSVINARIDGMLSSKSTVDVKELEKQKADYEKELTDIKSQMANILEADNKKRQEISKLESKLSEIKANAMAKFEKDETALRDKLREIEKTHAETELSLMNAQNSMSRIKASIESDKDTLENYRSLYKKVQNETLDDESTKCPVCNRVYPKSQLDNIKSDFEQSKSMRLGEYKAKAESLKEEIAKAESNYAVSEKECAEKQKKTDEFSKKIETIREKLRSLTTPDYESLKTYKDTVAKIDALKTELNTTNDLKQQELSKRESYLNQMIHQIIGELAVADRNKEIDIQIETLRKERSQHEINRANAEKIISQVDEFNKTKNGLLSDEINKHFKLVNFKLFDYLKNGNYTEVCEPLIDGKTMTSHSNGSLKVLCKLDIISGLQDYYNEYFPVFADDYSLFTSNTENRIDMDAQLIKLIATEGVKELEVKGE